ncbi:MAG TPA: ADOP family duplicated permease [Vicinamibacterales bacterium]|nr:ADOP family duplicated permease [Vicinamibacterales bacterium]
MIRRWFRRRPSDDEMLEELEAHVAMRAEHDGVNESVARRRLGNVLRTREEMRRVWIARWWDALRQDAHYTWRSWRRRPAFALAAIVVLALGLGSSTALFAALDRVLFRPLPYADPDRLVSVGLLTSLPNPRTGRADPVEMMLDKPYVQLWNPAPAPFESVTAMGGTDECTIGETQPAKVTCARVDFSFLRVLGVTIAEGRDFTPEDDVRGAPLVAVISHALWRSRYGADPAVVGRTLSLDSANAPVQRAPIVGVLPADFEMPIGTADILLPMRMRPLDTTQPFMSILTAFGRLRAGVSAERATLMLAPQLPEVLQFMPPAGRAMWSTRAAWHVQTLRDRRVGDSARVAWLLIGAVGILLLIACVNVANLMLTRVAERQREFAIRAAVGAGKVRLAGLALAESMLLALAAGGIGLLLAFALLNTFVAMAPAGLPGIAEASIDLRVFVVAVVLIALTGLAIGVWPALSIFRAGRWQGLQSTGTSSPGARPRVRFALVTTQIALTLALLGGSALLLRSLWNVVAIPLGFEASRVVTVSVGLSATRYPTPAHRSAYFDELLARAAATPGTVAAALSNAPAPLGATMADASSEIEGRSLNGEVQHDPIRVRQVTSEYFDTFRIRMTSGRAFAAADRDGEPVAVLTESAKRILFGGEAALGRRIRFVTRSPWHRIVGVAEDLRNGGDVTAAPAPEVYLIAPRDGWRANGHLALRTTATPADAEAYLRRIAADLDPLLPVTVERLDTQVTRLTARPRFTAWLLAAFGGLALLLAAAGLYSVASFLVAQRRRDIGVRIAIGASPRTVAQQVVVEAGRWIIAGALLGSVLGWMGTRALQSQLYEVQALDPAAWTAAVLALALVLLAAVWRPARHAAHVDPIAALRAE